MSTYNKVKGTKWETDIENYINEMGFIGRRLPRAGTKDLGDVALIITSDLSIVIEAKNVGKPNMAEFLRQAGVEAGNFECKYGGEAHGVVVTKTRGKGVADGRVTMTLEGFLELLRRLT